MIYVFHKQSQQTQKQKYSYTSRITASFDGWIQRWNKMKAGCWTSGILQDVTVELSSYEHVLYLRKGKNNLKYILEIYWVATATMVPEGRDMGICLLLDSKAVRAASQNQGFVAAKHGWGIRATTLVYTEDRDSLESQKIKHWAKEDYS